MTAPTVAPPRSSVADIARRVGEAFAGRQPLRILGAGTWLTSGAPVDATMQIACDVADIIEYVPGDLTMTVGGGASLATIEAVTAAEGQWLTLDPFGTGDGSIGATVATASAGPLATAFGTPRDLVLGIEAVTGAGRVIRGGGRVVKNVAGFDLVRLFTGSRGTLGVITEVTVRLRARPPRDETIAIAVRKPDGIADVGRVLRGWPFTPMAAEVIDGRCAAAVGLPAVTSVLLRLGGNARAVDAQRKAAATLGRPVATDPTIWTRLRSVDRGAAAVIRLGDLPSSFADRWTDAQSLVRDAGMLVGSPARGTLRVILPDLDLSHMDSLRSRAKTTLVVHETLPTPRAWHALTVEVDPASLEGRVRAAFDPAGIMNPGILRVAR